MKSFFRPHSRYSFVVLLFVLGAALSWGGRMVEKDPWVERRGWAAGVDLRGSEDRQNTRRLGVLGRFEVVPEVVPLLQESFAQGSAPALGGERLPSSSLSNPNWASPSALAESDPRVHQNPISSSLPPQAQPLEIEALSPSSEGK